jgi:hypothetical protein
VIADSPAEPIQVAVFVRASTDAALATLGAAVVDDTDGAPYPYVSIGEGTETADNAHDQFGRDSTITLHVWSSESGFQQANRIANRLVQLFDHQPLTVEGHRVVAVRALTLTRLLDPREPFVRHVAVPFRVVTAQQT